ncbi:MAG: 5'-nucleotidase C-terminal domain-containing protein [Polyangiaceae bacterium]
MKRASWILAGLGTSLLGLSASLLGAGCDDGAGGTGGGGGGAPKDKHLVVLFTSDEHSHLFAFSPELDDFPIAAEAGDGSLVGGVARRATVIAALRKEAKDAGKDSILVSAGDNQMGCLPHLAFESGSIDYATMKALGYDATTFGNHEFDFGPKALASSLTAAKATGAIPPIVASNIHFSETDPGDDGLAGFYSANATDDALVHPYRVLTTASGIKVGLIGYVGINAAHVAPNKTPVEFSVRPADFKTDGDVDAGLPSLYADLQPIVDRLHADEKVDVVIALAHGGVDVSTTAEGIEAGEDTRVCDNVSGIDFIVSGHSHNHDKTPIQRTNKATGKPCLVLNAGSFGEEVGRVDFTIPNDASKGITWDKASQDLVKVDSKTAPTADLVTATQGYVAQIEAAGMGESTLAKLLGNALGMTISDNAGTPGDLFFYPVGKTTFDVTDTHALIDLSADAMLLAADAWGKDNGGVTTDLSVESAGVIRNILKKGKTGVISAADAFDVVPLGSSPVDGSVGYPLIRGFVSVLELRGTVEFGISRGATSSDFDLGFAGVKVEYDATRPPAVKLVDLFDPTKGQVMRLSIDTDHSDGLEQFDKVIYDRDAMIEDPNLVSFTTSSYVGQFATDAGVTIKDAMGAATTVPAAIIKRSNGSEIKQVESFMSLIHGAPGGALPATYDKSSASFTKRVVCVKGC